MKIIVFGVSGSMGNKFCCRALGPNRRDNSSLGGIDHENLGIAKGEVLDPVSITK
jgi:hypothetical protein